MEVSELTDKSVEPNDEIVFSIIGNKKTLWQEIFRHMDKKVPGYAGEWKYYNDGNSWLFRARLKKKTLFWIRVVEHTFRVAFWFSDKAEPLILQSDLDSQIREEFMNAEKYQMGSGHTRSIVITPAGPGDVETIRKLIELKTMV